MSGTYDIYMPQKAQQEIQDLGKIIEIQQEVVTTNLGLQHLMNLICERTQNLTQASAAVVEIAEGPHMVYRACTGTAASALGIKLNIDTSLSGLSVKKNEVLYCEDSETDPRVDREACRRVGARSMICVPLIYRNSAIGVLKVYSAEEQKFSDRDINVLRITAGLLSASISQAREAEEKEAADMALKENENKFRTLFEASYDTIMISQGGIIVDVNQAFTKLFGYTRNEIRGRSMSVLILDSDLPKVQRNYERGIETPYEFICVRKDKTHFIVEGIGKSIELDGQRIRMSTLRDVTEKINLENNLRRSEQKSREASIAKSEFLANMSHEIQTPLNGVLGMTHLLSDSDLNSEQRQHLDMIRSSAESLLSVVNDILDFSKIEAKKLTLEKIDFELKPAVEDIRQILNYAASRKGLNFICKYDDNLPQFVNGDPSRLRQIILNLANNAIKFTESGSITIDVKELSRNKVQSELQFQVTDTGIGIPQSAIKNMFQAFTQVDASTTRRFGGTGLGLSISRQLVELMNGQIGVTSQEGQGSTFWFTLPAGLAEAPVKSEKKSTGVSEDPRMKLRLLIAEDNTVNQMIVKAMVQKAGHTCTIVANGKEALEAIKLAPYDAILMDCQMPEMDGFEATRRIRASFDPWAKIEIIAMTANAMAGDRERCLDAGMNDYVAKPTRIDELLLALQKVATKLKQAV